MAFIIHYTLQSLFNDNQHHTWEWTHLIIGPVLYALYISTLFDLEDNKGPLCTAFMYCFVHTFLVMWVLTFCCINQWGVRYSEFELFLPSRPLLPPLSHFYALILIYLCHKKTNPSPPLCVTSLMYDSQVALV